MSDSCDSSVSFIKQNDGKRNIDCEDIEIISNYQEVVTQAEELRKLKAAIQESEVREKMQALKIQELEKENEDKYEKSQQLLVYESELRQLKEKIKRTVNETKQRNILNQSLIRKNMQLNNENIENTCQIKSIEGVLTKIQKQIKQIQTCEQVSSNLNAELLLNNLFQNIECQVKNHRGDNSHFRTQLFREIAKRIIDTLQESLALSNISITYSIK